MTSNQPTEETERIPAPGTMAYAQWKRRQELLGQKPETQETGKPASQPDIRVESQEAVQLTGRQTKRMTSQPASKPAGSEPRPVDSILTKRLKPLADETPVVKTTFQVTTDEAEILEELKLQLRRRLKVKATKNDILRAAIRLVTQDFVKNQQTSFLARKLGGK